MANILQIKRTSIGGSPFLHHGELAHAEQFNEFMIGAPDASIQNFTGAYDNGRTYNAGDAVTSGGDVYVFKAFIGAAGYGPVTHPNAWDLVPASLVKFIGGEGQFLTLTTNQSVLADTDFTNTVALSTSVTVTQPTTANDTLVANTEFVQNVFSVLDGGNFDENLVPTGVGKYFYTATTANDANKWWTIGSWYTDANHVYPAASLPDGTTDVVVLGNIGPFINLDRNDWVQPHSIFSGSATIDVYSVQANTFTASVTGNVTFSGYASFNK